MREFNTYLGAGRLPRLGSQGRKQPNNSRNAPSGPDSGCNTDVARRTLELRARRAGEPMRVIGFALLLLLGAVSQACAWGQEGHSIVAEIANRGLAPPAAQKISELRLSELRGLAERSHIVVASIASWADCRPTHDESPNGHFTAIS